MEKDNYVVERGKRDREFLNWFMATVPTNLFLSLQTSTFLGMYNSNRRDACRITDRIYNSEKKKKNEVPLTNGQR